MNYSELDYYAILNIPRSAPKEEIALAYRKLAVKLCPNRDPKTNTEFVPEGADVADMTHMKPLPKNRQWEYINMAYDILGNELHRAIYDRYGETGLLQGVLLPNGYFPPYQYHGDHMKIYQSVFGSYSPYAGIIDAITNPPSLYTSKEYGIGVRTKDPPEEKIIELDLKEVRFGCVKLMTVYRQEFIDDEQILTEKRKKVLTLEIPPGVTAGTRFTFKEEGDRCHTKIPADIVFIIADKPNERFVRHNHTDLIYTHDIDLCDALVGVNFNIKTLDNRNLKIAINDVIHPYYIKKYIGEGLPKCPKSYLQMPKVEKTILGDLYVKFNTIFPTYLNNEMKIYCREFFERLAESEEQSQGDQATNAIDTILKKQ
ncbi:dnaJ homolog subfamily B member 13 [Teleopsis dalmanni]|uniref:dnaJ homolog subfamily B member 13 n=1 Tax=Teleopsis dalmanni TaxID=139649 RepID=UPI000D32B187|nr:dnaJ homolog subfamily B member 13 [Teleopsis dalmanni]